MATVQEHNYETAICQLNEATVRQDMALVTLHGLVPFKDGNQWCYLLGENLQEGIAGFGDTPYKAAVNFNNNFYNETVRVNEIEPEGRG